MNRSYDTMISSIVPLTSKKSYTSISDVINGMFYAEMKSLDDADERLVTAAWKRVSVTVEFNAMRDNVWLKMRIW